MKIKLDDKQFVYLVTLIFSKDNNERKIEINQSIQKEAKDDYEAVLLSTIELQKKHENVNVMVKSAMQLTPQVFITPKPNHLKIESHGKEND